MYIVVDFDGTVVTHEYPKVGVDIGAAPVLKKLIKAGHKLILFTMRDGDELKDAVKWFKNNNIELFGIQTNPTQRKWTSSPKAYGQLIIDDIGLGCPVIKSKDSARKYVDWVEVEHMLKEEGILPYEAPITPTKLAKLFSEATENLGNSEMAFNIREIVDEYGFKLIFNIDAGRYGADHSGQIDISTDGEIIDCTLSDYLYGNGIEKYVENKISEILNK